MPNMRSLGYFNIDGVHIGGKEANPKGAFARLTEVSKGKYTTIWQQKKKTSVELKISKDKYYKVRAWYKKDGELIYGAFSKAIKAS